MTQPLRFRSIRAYRSVPAPCQLLQSICTALARPGAMFTGFVGVFFIVGLTVPVFAQTKEQNRIENSGMVMDQILNIPDNIPGGLLSKAECVLVIPTTRRFPFIVDGSAGQEFGGPWGAPSMMAPVGTSFGLQAGCQATDFVLLLMNPRAAAAILSSEVRLGVGGRFRCGGSARSRLRGGTVSMRAEILSYSQARGLFAGISLVGSTLRADNRANQNLYKKHLDAKAIVLKGEVAAPQKSRATCCFGGTALRFRSS